LSKHRANREKADFKEFLRILWLALCGDVQRAVRKRTTAAIYEILESELRKMEANAKWTRFELRG